MCLLVCLLVLHLRASHRQCRVNPPSASSSGAKVSCTFRLLPQAGIFANTRHDTTPTRDTDKRHRQSKREKVPPQCEVPLLREYIRPTELVSCRAPLDGIIAIFHMSNFSRRCVAARTRPRTKTHKRDCVCDSRCDSVCVFCRNVSLYEHTCA